MFTKSKTKDKKGFTLIELLVVISIIGLLSTLAVVALGNARARARDAKRLNDATAILKAMELYAETNNGSYVGACKISSGAVPGSWPTAVSSCVGQTGGTGLQRGIAAYLPNIAAMNDPQFTSTMGNCGSGSSAVCNYAFSQEPATDTFVVYFWQETQGTGGGVRAVTQKGVLTTP